MRAAERVDVRSLAENVQKQRVIGLQHGLGLGLDQAAAKGGRAFDAQDVDPGRSAQVQLLQPLVDQRAFGADDNAEFPIRQAIAVDPVGKPGTRDRGHLAVRRQPAAGHQHIADGKQQDRQAERGEVEKPEAPVPLAAQQAAPPKSPSATTSLCPSIIRHFPARSS